jgi:type II secretory pathway pseudopilin PulG
MWAKPGKKPHGNEEIRRVEPEQGEKNTMRKIFIIMAVAVGVALGAQAQQSAELSALQQQLNELSAKIAQLEKANAEKAVVAEQAVQLENANAAKIAQIEQDNAKKTWSIEQLQAEGKKNLAGAWANDIKLAGDFRYRYENRDVADETTKDRQRIRARLGVYGKVNEYTDFGLRLATGTGGSRTSSNADMGENGDSMKDIWLDQAYVDMHPETFGGAHLILGKMPQPWITYGSGLIWDTDFNPEGAVVTYEKDFLPFKLKANGGMFIVRENLDEDIQFYAGQVAVEKKIGPGTLTLGVSDYSFDNETNLVKYINAKSANTPGGQFNLVEGFGSYGFTAFNIPVLLLGQYVVNTEAATSEDTAYLGGITIGKAKDKGTWEIGYSYRDIQKDAVVGGFNDSDFAGETWTGCHGHWFKAKYQLSKNLSLDGAYILSTDYLGQDANTVQADLNFKF